MYDIEKNIPVPKAAHSGRGRPARYPFADMLIGDSFWVAVKTPQKRINITASASIYGKRHGMSFVTRAETKNGVKGVRVWRVEAKPQLKIVA